MVLRTKMELFEVYLPIAGIGVNLLFLSIVGIFTGIITSLFGLGGGFIMIPYLSMAGMPIGLATVTSMNQMTAATLSSFITYAHLKQVDYKMSIILLAGGIIGIIVSYGILYALTKIGNEEVIISVIFTVLLSIVAISVTKDAINVYVKSRKKETHEVLETTSKYSKFFPLKTTFISSNKKISIIVILLIGLLGGILVTVLGIGGAIVTIPVMLYGLKLRERFIVGTTHLQICVTSIISTFIHAVGFTQPDLILAICVIPGSVIGTKIGAFLSHKISTVHFRMLFAIVMIVLSTGMIKNVLTLFHTQQYQVVQHS